MFLILFFQYFLIVLLVCLTFSDISSDARFNFYKDDFAMLTLFFASLKTFQMSQSFDRYNSVLQVLIENYRISVNKSTAVLGQKRPKY